MDSDNKESNFYDDLGSPSEKAGHLNELDYLIHQCFEQNEAGKQLLDIWRESVLMSAVAFEGRDGIGIGIAEGKRQFVIGIIQTVRKVENDK